MNKLWVIQIISVLVAIGGFAAMMIEYYDHDLAHMSTVYIGGGLAEAGVLTNAVAALVRAWKKKH